MKVGFKGLREFSWIAKPWFWEEVAWFKKGSG